MAGRPSRLEEPGFLKAVADCFYAGMSRPAMCKALDVKDPDTISRWRKDPRVKALVARMNEERVQQISRKVDSEVEARLANAEKMKVEDLIKIRKEYGGVTQGRKETTDDSTIAEAMQKLEDDPQFAEKLARFIASGGEDTGGGEDEALSVPPLASQHQE